MKPNTQKALTLLRDLHVYAGNVASLIGHADTEDRDITDNEFHSLRSAESIAHEQATRHTVTAKPSKTSKNG